MILCRVAGLVAGLGGEHRAGDRKQAIRNRAEGTGMAVAAGTKSGVLGLADGVVLDCGPRPVVDCVSEAGMGRQGGARRACTCRIAV